MNLVRILAVAALPVLGIQPADAAAGRLFNVVQNPPNPPQVNAIDGGAELNAARSRSELMAAQRRHQADKIGRRSNASQQSSAAEIYRKCMAEAQHLATNGLASGDPCGSFEYGRPTQDVPTRPTQQAITATLVQSATRRLPFPGFQVQIEPAGKTLVNLNTNVYTISKPFVRTVTILTWPVKIRATPTTYRWNFGDGTTEATTSTPGAPHPNARITHKYKDRHAENGGLKVSVTVTYDTWYKVQGLPWQNAGPVTIPGPGTPLLVCEARPVLTDPNNPNPMTPTPDPTNPCTQ